MRSRRLVLFLLAFLAFRALLFTITTGGEYLLFQKYGEVARETSLAELYRTREVEYPHLGIAIGTFASYVTDVLPSWVPHLVSLRPNKWEEPYLSMTPAERERTDRYEVGFSLVVFAFDLACLGLVYVLARRLYPEESWRARYARLVVYAVMTGANGLILYDRQDLMVGFFALLAVWCLAADRPRLGYVVLTLGAAYKLVPLLLLPLWVLAAAAQRSRSPREFLFAVLREAAIAGAILALWPLLTYQFGGGDRGFLFLTFHSTRGLQLEAPVAWPVLLLDTATEVGHGFGSYNLRGDLADRVAALTRPAMEIAVALALAIAARDLLRRIPNPYSARRIPHAVLLVWLAFIVANKVGSPQYLLWLAPLVPLLPLRTGSERGWAILLLVAMLVTTLVFPCRYYADVRGPMTNLDPATWRGPNGFGLFLLTAKSATLTIALVWLAVSVWRTPQGEPDAP